MNNLKYAYLCYGDFNTLECYKNISLFDKPTVDQEDSDMIGRIPIQCFLDVLLAGLYFISALG